jgi:hypothetical protein
MRPNAHLYIKPDAYRYMPAGTPRLLGADATRYFWPGAKKETPRQESSGAIRADSDQLSQARTELAILRAEFKFRRFLRALKANFNPSQPRDDRGRWADAGSADNQLADGSDPRILSDAEPDSFQEYSQYAQDRSRGQISVRIGNQTFQVEGGQAARLVEAQARAEFSTARVRETEPNWRPEPSAYETVEGLIRAYNAQAQEAQNRASELARAGIGPGPFARESIEARSPNTDFTAAERREMNRIGEAFGCHTCGTLNSGSLVGNFVPDHQPPTQLNPLSSLQRLYPQCVSCSQMQGGMIRRYRSR